MRDIRDNADRICLTAGLPALNTILQEIAEANKKRQAGYTQSPMGHVFGESHHFQRSKPTRFTADSKPAKKSKGSSSRKPIHVSDVESS